MPWTSRKIGIARFTIMALATLANSAAVAATPLICGTIVLSDFSRHNMYADSCYGIQGAVRGVFIDATCDCEFFRFDTCNAKPMTTVEIDVSVGEIKGYFCQRK